VSKSVTRITVELHNKLEKLHGIHRDAVGTLKTLFGHIPNLETIVSFDSGNVARGIHRRSIRLTGFGIGRE